MHPSSSTTSSSSLRKSSSSINVTVNGSSSNSSSSSNNSKRRTSCSPSLALMLFWLICAVLLSTIFTLTVTLHLHDDHDQVNKNNNHNHDPSGETNYLQQQLYQNAMTLHTNAATASAAAGRHQSKEKIVPEVFFHNDETSSMDELRERLPPSVWTMAGKNSDPVVAQRIQAELDASEKEKASQLCGKFLYSTLQRAVQVGDMGESTFVATGDIDDMWTRDSAVQMGIYMGRMTSSSSSSSATAAITTPTTITVGQPWLRLIVEGAIRRQAFNIIQDPYANAYEKKWIDPSTLQLRDRVIGRGGWVATRNYELDSGAYFLTQLYDYYVTENLYRPDKLLQEPMIFDAVMLMIDVWIVEQHHEELSPYRYFELPREGKGVPSGYTGMTWTGFRPSDDPCEFGYLIPANIHAAAGLERVLELNKRVWKSTQLHQKATKLLQEIEDGIQKHGVVKNQRDGDKLVYAYEVDGLGGVLSFFDDANVPSLLSIPLLGWSKYDREVYRNTRKMLLSPETNKYYFVGDALRGIGSPHTPKGFVWPMAFAIEALTEEGSKEHIAKTMVFQIRQSLKSACDDAMHEGVDVRTACEGSGMRFSRKWFEWANALFVVLLETALGERCDMSGRTLALAQAASGKGSKQPEKNTFYQNKYKNDPKGINFYQGVEALVPHYE